MVTQVKNYDYDWMAGVKALYGRLSSELVPGNLYDLRLNSGSVLTSRSKLRCHSAVVLDYRFVDGVRCFQNSTALLRSHATTLGTSSDHVHSQLLLFPVVYLNLAVELHGSYETAMVFAEVLSPTVGPCFVEVSFDKHQYVEFVVASV